MYRDGAPRYLETIDTSEDGSAIASKTGALDALQSRHVNVATITLHCGLASSERPEPPMAEWMEISPHSAQMINHTKACGGRVIAIGTTVVRALETVTDADGQTYPGEGWTCTVVTPADGIRSANALLTGFHEPRSSHLAMLEALAGREHLRLTYSAAIDEGYLWHEFGDLHLILPCGDATGN